MMHGQQNVKYHCLMLHICSFIVTPSVLLVSPIYSLPHLHGILHIHCGLSLNSFGFIFLKKPPIVFFVLNSVVMLNLLPMLWNFLQSPLICGTDNIHAGCHYIFAFYDEVSYGSLTITYSGYALNNISFFIKFSLAKLFCLLALYTKFCTTPFF